MDPSLMYEAIGKGEVDVVCAFATDGRIAAYNLRPLQDDLKFFPPYHAAPVISEEILRLHPNVGDVLSNLGGMINDETMQRLNFEVDGEKQGTAQVAKRFLESKGLIKTVHGAGMK